jgi:hypothetical protein
VGQPSKIVLTLTAAEAQSLLALARAGSAAVLPNPMYTDALLGKSGKAAAGRALKKLLQAVEEVKN